LGDAAGARGAEQVEAKVDSGVETRGANVVARALLLYGAYNLCHNVAYLVGYHLLSPGAMSGSHPAAIARRVAEASGFWGEFGGTLLMNLLVMGSICVLLNLQRVGSVPLGYLVTVFLGVTTGLFLGTNSLAALDLTHVPFLSGTAKGLTVGGGETLGYVCLIAATARLSIYQRQTWWRWSERFVRVRSLRDARLTVGETLVLAAGVVLIVVAAYRET
jgi:hypothetical protein